MPLVTMCPYIFLHYTMPGLYLMYVPVRRHANWMSQSDERLLEYLDMESGGSPKEMAADERLPYHEQSIGRRLRQLAAAGFVDRIGHGAYVITDQGRAYLAGEFDARDIDKPTSE